jgi:hypothetical protein
MNVRSVPADNDTGVNASSVAGRLVLGFPWSPGIAKNGKLSRVRTNRMKTQHAILPVKRCLTKVKQISTGIREDFMG